MDNKICATCTQFEGYYTKAYSCFLRTDCGHCHMQDKTVQKKDCCEKWKYRQMPRRDKLKVVTDGLNEALKKINAIQLILEEEKE